MENKQNNNQQPKGAAEPLHLSLDSIVTGMHICWSVCTDARFDSVIVLSDETGKEYARYVKEYTNGTVDFICQGQGNALFTGKTLYLDITSDASPALKRSVSDFVAYDADGAKVGEGYNVCVEDWTDEDYCDIFLNIVGWSR